MKAYIKRLAIEKALNGLAGILKSKPQHLPVLEHVWLNASGKTITLIATDLDTTIKISIGADVIREGVVLPVGKKLIKVVDMLKDSEVIIIEEVDKKVKITGDGKASYKLNCALPDDYPGADLPDSLGFTEVKREDLLSIIGNSIYAADSNPYTAYTGVYLTKLKDEMRCVATNGMRLAITRSAREEEFAIPDQGVVLPVSGAKKIIHLLKHHCNSERVEVGFNSDTMMVRSIASSGNILLAVRLLTAKFPNYEKAIPTGDCVSFTADKKTLMGSLRRMKVVAKGDSKCLYGVSLSGSSDKIILKSENDSGFVSEEIDLKDSSREAFQILVNANYLLDAVKTVSADDIYISYKKDCMLAVNGDGRSTNIVAVLRN